MKKNILSILAICAALFGCQKNEISEPSLSGDDLHATIEDDASTKTVMDEHNNIRWSEGDQIVAFMKTSYGHKYQVKPSFVGKTYADFSKISSFSGDDLSAGMEWEHVVAYYPYTDGVECVKSGDDYTINVVLPAQQTYAAESFGSGYWPMVAVSEDNDITFKNLCGGIKFQIKGTQKVVSVHIRGNDNEKLSGAAIVTAYTDNEAKPAISMISTASTSVTLNCAPGVQLSENTPTEFIIALPPVAFTKGFTVTFTDDAGKTCTVETDKANYVLRSHLLSMPAVDWIDDKGTGQEGSADVKKVSRITITDRDYVTVADYFYDEKGRLNTIDITEDGSNYSMWYNYDKAGMIAIEIGDDFNIYEKIILKLDSENRVAEMLMEGEDSGIKVWYCPETGYTESIDYGNGVSYMFKYSNGMVTEWQYINENYEGGTDALPVSSDWFAHKYPNDKINLDLNMQLFNAEFAYPVPFVQNSGKFGEYLVEKRMMNFKPTPGIPEMHGEITTDKDYVKVEIFEYMEVIGGDEDWNDVTYEFDDDGCPVEILNEVKCQKYSKTVTYKAGDILWTDEDAGVNYYSVVLDNESDPVKGEIVTYAETTVLQYLQ